jgi:hypothetical protein
MVRIILDLDDERYAVFIPARETRIAAIRGSEDGF